MKMTQDGPALARLLELKTKTHRALSGDSNDAEHDALYEVKEALVGLTPDVRRMEKALKLCLEFLQTGEIQPRGERHPYSLWAAAVSSGHMALGQRLKGRGWNIALETDSKTIHEYIRGIKEVAATDSALLSVGIFQGRATWGTVPSTNLRTSEASPIASCVVWRSGQNSKW